MLTRERLSAYADGYAGHTGNRGGRSQQRPAIGLQALAALRALTERLVILQADDARKLGRSWLDIATRLGVTKHGVHRKHRHRIGKR